MTFALEIPDALVEAAALRAAELLRTDRRFISKTALAERLGVSERRIKTLREHGLPGRKIGRDIYFDIDEVYRFIDGEGDCTPSLRSPRTGTCAASNQCPRDADTSGGRQQEASPDAV